MKKYFGFWTCREDMCKTFEASASHHKLGLSGMYFPEEEEVIFAHYGYPDYSWDEWEEECAVAVVIFSHSKNIWVAEIKGKSGESAKSATLFWASKLDAYSYEKFLDSAIPGNISAKTSTTICYIDAVRNAFSKLLF